MVALKRKLFAMLFGLAFLLLTIMLLKITINMRQYYEYSNNLPLLNYHSIEKATLTRSAKQCRPVKYLSFDELLLSESTSISSTEERDSFTHPPPVTRILHQSWKDKQLPGRFKRWSRTWCECFPDWTHVLWSDVDNERFVKQQYSWFLPRYRAFNKSISRADAVRYLYLHRFGGLYADLDTICLRPFESHLAHRPIVLGDMKARERQTKSTHFYYIQNSLMYSRPGHPFWLDLLHRIERLEGDTPKGPVAGPITLMDELWRQWDKYSRDFVIYPPETFNPFSWDERDPSSPCRDLNQMDEKLLVKCIEYYRSNNRSFVLELHTETWRRGRVK